MIRPTGKTDGKQNIRDTLMLIGMGLFLIAMVISLVNMLVLPTARVRFEYPAFSQAVSFAASLLIITWLGRRMRRLGLEQLDRTARVVRPALIVFILIVQLIMGYVVEYTPMGDNATMMRSASQLAQDGYFSQNPEYGLYMARFSNQWGFLTVLTILFRLFRLLGFESYYMPLMVTQALLYTVGVSSVLSIARRLRGVRGELMTASLLALFLPFYLAAAVLYTDTFSLPFMMLTLRLALAAKDARTGRQQFLLAVLCGVTAFIGSQVKMTVFIALIAASIIWLLSMRPARAAACVGVCIAIVFTGISAVHGYMFRTVVDREVFNQHNTPYIHWVMMSIPTENNPYGDATQDYHETWTMMEEGATSEEVMSSIYTRMKDRVYSLRYPSRLIPALLRKNANNMGDGTFGMTEMLDDGPVRENAVSSFVLLGRTNYALYSAVCSGYLAAVMLLCAAGSLRDIRRRDVRSAMLQVTLFGAMLFLMLWESRSRYIFSFAPLMLILAALYVTREEQPGVTLRERFAPQLDAVGRFGDHTLLALRRFFGPSQK